MSLKAATILVLVVLTSSFSEDFILSPIILVWFTSFSIDLLLMLPIFPDCIRTFSTSVGLATALDRAPDTTAIETFVMADSSLQILVDITRSFIE